MKLDNKGQSLVLFVLCIPVFMVLMVMVVDMGNLAFLKLEMNNVNKLATSYAVDNLDADNLQELVVNYVKLNLDDVDRVKVSLDDNVVLVQVEKEVSGLFGYVVDMFSYEIKSCYSGSLDDGKKVIERVD